MGIEVGTRGELIFDRPTEEEVRERMRKILDDQLKDRLIFPTETKWK